MLDAGTGTQSARWIAGLTSTRWTAVSADAGHLAETRDAVSSKIRAVDRLIVGNWSDANFLANDVFDTVLAEYLLGAIEGYAPYFQYLSAFREIASARRTANSILAAVSQHP